MEQVGVVKHIRRYPVKSMMGEDLETARVETGGLVGDRVYAFVDKNSPNPRFPWMTARQAHEMLLYEPSLSDSGLVVKCPDGKKFSVEDGRFKIYLEKKYGYELSLKQDKISHCFDSKPISLIGLETIKLLGKETQIPLDHTRFRANFYIDFQKEPYYEDTLLNKTLKMGKVEIKIVKKDSRCVIPTLDPQSSKESPVVLQMIQKHHGGCTGVYAIVEKQGSVSVGDTVQI
ncbi:MAG: MOSC domain-containing protein [Nitrososphaerales archaeon]